MSLKRNVSSFELSLTLGMLILSFVLLVNFSELVGVMMLGSLLIYLISINSSRIGFVRIINDKYDISKILMYSSFLFLGWLVLTYFTITFISPNAMFSVFSVTNIFNYFATKSEVSYYVLSQDKFIQLLSFGIVMPIVESLLALSLILKYWADRFRIPIMWRPKDIRMWYVIILVGAIMGLTHLTTRYITGGLQSLDSLLITDGLFFSIGAMWVFLSTRVYKTNVPQMAEGMLMHLFINLGKMISVLKIFG